jgi:hypothetical protein
VTSGSPQHWRRLRRGAKVQDFFFEKKKQNAFANCPPPRKIRYHPKTGKSFLVLFFKKERLPSFFHARP